MTKNPEFQKQLTEVVKEGVKPSDIRKLKKSKSADDISASSTPSLPLKKSQSQLEIPLTQPSLQEQNTNLKEQVKFHAETAQNYLQSLQTSQAKVSELEAQIKNNPPNPLLQEQLKTKQKEVEELRKKLEQKNDELKNTTQQLDNSLFARVEAVKQFDKIHDQLQKIKQELNENVEQASDELINQDQQISQYRTNQRKAQARIQELEKDLNLAERLAELRKYPLPDNSPELDYLKYGFCSLLTVSFIVWLLNSKPTQ